MKWVSTEGDLANGGCRAESCGNAMNGPVVYPPHPITFEQYMAEEQVKRRYDIVNGVRVFAVPPSLRHQDILGNILVAFLGYAKLHKYTALFSLFDVLISREPFCTRQPDVMLVSKSRMQAHKDGEPLSVAPELVVEILSSIDRELALANKLRDYAATGVQECWVVRPETERIEVRLATAHGLQAARIFAAGETAYSHICPNLAVSVDEVMAA